MAEVRNAKIEYTKLGTPCSDHGIQTFIIGLDYGGSGQGYGMLCLDSYKKELERRTPTILASSLLLAVYNVFGVDWEGLKGLHCRALSDYSHVYAIGDFLRDKWLWYDKTKEEFIVTKLEEIEVVWK